MGATDLVVLAVVALVVGLIVRGMVRKTIRTCDSDGCGGNCDACGHACPTSLRLSEAQLKRLREIDERGRAL